MLPSLKAKLRNVAARKGAQWDEEQKLEDILEKRGMKGSSLKLEVMQKVPEPVVQERMSQGKGAKGPKEKKKVQGWSIEEMKEKQMLLWWKTEAVIKWRGLRQSEIDQSWKKLAERMEEKVLNKYEVE